MAVKKSVMVQDDAAALSAKVHEAAYERWRLRGCPTGSALEDWLYAESAILGSQAPKKKRAAAAPRRKSAASGS